MIIDGTSFLVDGSFLARCFHDTQSLISALEGKRLERFLVGGRFPVIIPNLENWKGTHQLASTVTAAGGKGGSLCITSSSILIRSWSAQKGTS
jgi:hypothetical protein